MPPLSDWRMATAGSWGPRKHLRAPNLVEFHSVAVRLWMDAAKRYKRVSGATALIWKALVLT